MKRIATVFLCLLCTLTAVGETRDDTLLAVFWNLENFFDFDGDGPPGAWFKKRFYTKCNAVAKTLLWMGDDQGRLPDIAAFAEVENSFVLNQLLRSTALRRLDYSYVHYDSPDPRGIDVALIYRKSSLTLVGSRPHPACGGTTRDILEARFVCTATGDTLTFLVNHHPSKYGGPSSQSRRVAAMTCLAAIADSLGRRATVATGDFNDTPDAAAFGELEGRLVNLAEPLFERGEGSIRYDGRWELIDMFLVSPDLVESGNRSGAGGITIGGGRHAHLAAGEMRILRPPFLMTKDAAHGGEKPLRTFSGPRYVGGVSDHLPIALLLTSSSEPL